MRRLPLWCLCAYLLGVLSPLIARAQPGFGRIGEPINLTVGYQPYFTESWSGVVVRAMKLDEKYLPRGSHVEYQVALSGGGVLLKALQAGRQQIGYLGLMPSVTGAANRHLADLRIVAVAGRSDDICNQVLVRADVVPAFHDSADAVRWLDHRRFAVPFGTCADLFSSRIFDRYHVHPSNLFDQNVDLLSSSFRAGAIDAVSIWEPAASKLIDDGIARRIVDGNQLHEASASFLLVRAELLQQRPDVVLAWLRAEREAQSFMADPRNADAVVSMVQSQTSNYSATVLRHALYREVGGHTVLRLTFPFEITPELQTMLTRAAQFLYDSDRLDSPLLAPDAVENGAAQQLRLAMHSPPPSTGVPTAR